jgi:alkanesulfonate monooxygenase SsuD/methylene tetrahydromethanopterin reductase-like flavin-dependent oxidoreductase (luciferase family)
MLKLSGERSLGAHTYFVPAGHTRSARESLGETAILAPELACVLDDDAQSARSKARAYAALYLGLRNYTNNLLKHGFSERDIADGGSEPADRRDRPARRRRGARSGGARASERRR